MFAIKTNSSTRGTPPLVAKGPAVCQYRSCSWASLTKVMSESTTLLYCSGLRVRPKGSFLQRLPNI